MPLLEEVGKQIVETLAKHSEILNDHTERLQNIEAKVQKIDEQGRTLNDHTERLQNIEAKVQQIGEQMGTVAEFANAVNEMATAQKQLNGLMAKGFVEIDKKFVEIDKKSTEHTRILDALRNDAKDLKQNR